MGCKASATVRVKLPTFTPGETNTSLIVSFKDSLWEFGQYVYQVQLRRKSPQGDWITKCKVVWDNPYGRKAGLYVMTVIFTDLEPGTTYEARYRDTNLRQCHDNPLPLIRGQQSPKEQLT